MGKEKTILVAPLNWGLGHATRCIPIIQALLDQEYKVILASDGQALLLLQKEFPTLETIALPSYNITYPKNGRLFKWSMILSFPKIFKIIAAEKRLIKQLVRNKKIEGSISDGRLGIRNLNIPSVYITHQLNVFSGSMSFWSSKLHQYAIKKFDICWVPDLEDEDINLSGELGHLKSSKLSIRYLGILSRMEKKETPTPIDILFLLSGPEPQRSMLEKILKDTFNESDKRMLMVRGIVEENQVWDKFKNIQIVNFMNSEELEKTINQSSTVIARSGYSSLMDLVILGKNVFVIPTPGQYEQEYLAKYLSKLKLVPYCHQREFTKQRFTEVMDYKGFGSFPKQKPNFSDLFSLFQGK